MNTIDYEQKYKEALGWMKSLYGGLHGKTKEEAEKYFPELKESEEERVKKELIELISCMHDADPRKKGWIAWLEKQGEQETDEWKEGNIIRHGGILALVIRGRRVMKSNGEIFTVQYPDEWVKAAPKEIEHFLNEFEKQGQEKHLSEPIKDYQGSFTCWNNAHDFRPKHLQRCICYDKYMGGVYCYVYDDISKYWCTQTTEEHDSDGDNHISDYADYRITLWMPLPDTSFYPSKSWLEKQGEKEPVEWSEKDENMLKSIIATCELAEQDRDSSPAKHLLEMQTNWLKSLKQRIEGNEKEKD